MKEKRNGKDLLPIGFLGSGIIALNVLLDISCVLGKRILIVHTTAYNLFQHHCRICITI
ncbi:MAG: hypothetical protein HXS48_08745 [Theionarchaea archaeon]|nr:hypothetical protein [Theionarchaea archaeon]